MTPSTHTGPSSLMPSALLPRSRSSAKTRTRASTTLATAIVTLLLGACASTPPPDWQGNTSSALNSYTAAYLEGNTRVADAEFARAKSEIARTGKPELMAKIELLRCAAHMASLVLEPCTAYQALAADALPPEQTYADFLAGRWATLDLALLPEHYRGLVAQSRQNAAQPSATWQPSNTASSASQLSQIKDPLAQLLAASLLLKKELLTPADIGLAIDSASNQGWRRPLLAWLGIQHQRAQAAGDTAAAASLQRRIDLVLQTATR